MKRVDSGAVIIDENSAYLARMNEITRTRKQFRTEMENASLKSRIEMLEKRMMDLEGKL